MDNSQNSFNTEINKNNNGSIKIFVIFKLIISIFYFIPAVYIFAFGLLVNFFLLIIGAGGSKLKDTGGFSSTIGSVSFYTIIPVVISIILFIVAIISCVKFFKNKYNKAMDLILNILFIFVNICYILIFKGSLSFVLLLIFVTLLLLVNTYMIFKQK